MLTTTARLSPRRLTGIEIDSDRCDCRDRYSCTLCFECSEYFSPDPDPVPIPVPYPVPDPGTASGRCSDMGLWPICSSINLQSTFIRQRPERASANVSIHTLPVGANRDCANFSGSTTSSRLWRLRGNQSEFWMEVMKYLPINSQ